MNLLLQWKFLRGPLAEREAARAGGGGAGAVAVPRRVDAGLQGPLRRQAVDGVRGQVRGHVGQRAAGRLRLGDVRRWRYVLYY